MEIKTFFTQGKLNKKKEGKSRSYHKDECMDPKNYPIQSSGLVRWLRLVFILKYL